MFFDPRGGSVTKEQTRGVLVCGGDVDVPISKHFLVRAQYRGFVYKIPDFEMTSLKVDKYIHSAVPSAGLVRSSTVRLPPIFLSKAAGRAALIVSRLATVALMLALPVVNSGINSDGRLTSITCAEIRWRNRCKV